MVALFSAVLPLVFLAQSQSIYLICAIIVIAVGILVMSIKNMLKKVPRIKRCNIGFRGERLTAQYLQPLIGDGYYIFHDIPMGDYNVDHAIVGPKGVYAIETKTRRKRMSAGANRAKVLYDGKTLTYPECPPERYGLDNAVDRAKGLQKFLSSAVGESVSVSPILALPGWYIKRTGKGLPPVINPQSIPKFVRKYGRDELSDPQIKRILHQLREKVKIEKPL
jgi:hypothetical protein